MGLFNGVKNNETVAVFDIGSGSVGGALARLNTNGKPEVFSVSREPIAFQQNFSFQKFLSSMLQALNNTSQVLSRAHTSPRHIFCFLASPWYASQTRVIKFSKNTPFVFSKKLADNLIYKEIENFERAHLEKHLGPKGHARPIEHKIMSVKLNGYSVSNPIGQRALAVEMTMFISMSPESILLAIKEAIGHFFGHQIHFSSFPFASFLVCRVLFKNKSDFILMDAGSEITDVSLIKNNIIEESFSFPLGKNFLIKSLISGLGMTQTEAVSALTVFLSEKLQDSSREQVTQVLKNAQDEWLKYFRNTLTHITHDLSLPSEIILTADDDVAPWFIETIKKEEYNQNTLTGKNFNVIMLDTKAFSNVLNLDKVQDRDPFLMLEAVFAKEIKGIK